MLPIATLGVVYGDIGTSPLYALRECFFGERAVAVTPAISVLSAVEGLEVAAGDLVAPHIVPLTLTILAALFLLQRLGTGGVGKLFGPIMLLWFTVLGVGGAFAVVKEPAVLAAINPAYGIRFFVHGPCSRRPQPSSPHRPSSPVHFP